MDNEKYILAQLKRWLIASDERYLSPGEIMMKIADIEASVVLEDEELIPPKKRSVE